MAGCVCEQCCNLMLVETISKAPLNFHLVPFNNPRVQFTVQVSLICLSLSSSELSDAVVRLRSEVSRDQLPIVVSVSFLL